MSLPELQRQLHKQKSLGSTSGSNSREGGTVAARIGGASPTTGGLEIPDDAWRVWAVTGAVNILAVSASLPPPLVMGDVAASPAHAFYIGCHVVISTCSRLRPLHMC